MHTNRPNYQKEHILYNVLKTVAKKTYTPLVKAKVAILKKLKQNPLECSGCGKHLTYNDLEHIQPWNELNIYIADCNYCKSTLTVLNETETNEV